jgi:type IX secretion system PorP/SprF family membrane protein
MNHRLLFCTLFALFMVSALRAQDRQFSQFYTAPMYLNPALTGAFPGKYRIGLIYRDEWLSAVDGPSAAFAANMDLRFPIKYRSQVAQDAVGAGVLFFGDRNPYSLNSNYLSISGAFHKSLSRYNTSFLSAGFQLGLGQRSVGYQDILFDDQFNGTTGFTDPTGEALPENNLTYFDIGAGLHYAYYQPEGIGLFAGLSMFHINQPRLSFFFDSEEEIPISEDEILLRTVAHLGLQVPLGKRTQLLPRAVFMLQGPHMTLNAGTNFRYLVNDLNGLAFHVGGWARPVRNLDNIGLDAVIGMVGIEFQNFLLGMSYDFPMNDLLSENQGAGAFEISFAFLGNYDNETVLCPTF